MPDPKNADVRVTSGWDEATKYKALFDSIDEGFCVVRVLFDAQGKATDYVFIEANPAFERQTGLHNALGQSMRSLASEHEEHWFQIYGDVARTGQATRFDAEARALGRWYDVYAFAFGRQGENLVGILFNDISQRKALERAIEQQNQQLREASLRKDRFLAALSHELRNPLAPLSVAAELLDQPDLGAERLAQTGNVIRRQVGLMARLVDDLLDVARVTQGKLVLKRELVRPRSVIDAAVDAARPLIDRKQHTLEVDLGSTDPWLDADPVRLEQALTNLLVNAAKYTEVGGHIRLMSTVRAGQLHLQVQDNGIGMGATVRNHVFEMFAQDPRAAQQAEGGLGVGLYLVKELVGLHDGEVQAHSEGEGLGSTFTIRLPLADDTQGLGQAANAPAPAGAQTTAMRKVLVADDNRDAAEMLGSLLEMEGHRVRICYDGPSAFAHAQTFIPDVAILDIGMPKMNGYAVAKSLRGEPWAAMLVLVAATGWGDKDAQAQAVEAGFDHHLTKPIDLEELARILASSSSGRS